MRITVDGQQINQFKNPSPQLTLVKVSPWFIKYKSFVITWKSQVQKPVPRR
jgi:hypothetical protein